MLGKGLRDKLQAFNRIWDNGCKPQIKLSVYSPFIVVQQMLSHLYHSFDNNLIQNSKLINDNHYTIHHSSLHHATIFYNYIRHAADLPFSATHCNDSENLDNVAIYLNKNNHFFVLLCFFHKNKINSNQI
ncbi:hypothetical protein BpHYR1_030423 [Brachionus plicatilis]|uniref:Uncharacterized protein n=1 Tax=Brachionus plicatilis TaxID=10195 RepID=A0A3M7T8T1_BRAPC|nr:hypothetical protein BpHYR1_030423 [Brachionus plicatilis]